LDYSISDIEDSVGASIALSSDKIEVLMGRMRQPSLSLHGIEGAFHTSGAKTVIPAKVSGKFSVRLVPPQTPENVDGFIQDFIKGEFSKLGSKNKLELEYLHGGRPWVADHTHWNFEAAKAATRV
jgi:Cys-Gly metallodipeptidase DUG1